MRRPSRHLTRLLFIPDTHTPYHDALALNLAAKVAREWQPDRIVFLGDWQDFYCISRHDKSPERRQNLKWELEIGNGLLDTFKAPKVDFIAGNHEWRLERYLWTRAPELMGMLAVPDLLHLKKRGWSYTPYMHWLRIGKLNITHDVGHCGPNAHVQARAAFEGCAIIGHTHRMAVKYEGTVNGKSSVGAMFGWLGDFAAIDYQHQARARREWQHGFGIAHLEKNGHAHVQAIPIVDGACVVDGVRIS